MRSSSQALVVSMGILAACSDASDPVTVERPQGALGQLSVSLDFHSPPLEGWASIRPVGRRDDLSYRVDLDGDGVPEEAGPLREGVDVGYRYDSPGIHRIEVVLSAGAIEETLSLEIVAADPGAWTTLAQLNAQPPRSF